MKFAFGILSAAVLALSSVSAVDSDKATSFRGKSDEQQDRKLYGYGKRGAKPVGKKGGHYGGYGGGCCKYNSLELAIAHPPPLFENGNVILPTGGSSSKDLGTVYLWTAQIIFDLITGDEIGFVSGQCTRLFHFEDNEEGNELPGLGDCSFTYSDTSGNTVTLHGELNDAVSIAAGSGLLAVTGGTGEFQGAIGQGSYVQFDSGDVFDDADGYAVSLNFAVPVGGHHGGKYYH